MTTTAIEGLVLDKTPFQDRHLICRLLSRSGQKIPVMFYGGRGGGNKKKSGVLDLGAMVRVHPAAGGRSGGLCRAREWSPLWRHEAIRQSYRRFALLCFYLELAGKMAPEGDWLDGDGGTDCGRRLFLATANALSLLEEGSRGGTHRHCHFEATLFLAKVLVAEGVFPEVSRCMATGEPLPPWGDARLVADLGGFVSAGCLGGGPSDFAPAVHATLRAFLALAARTKYADVQEEPALDGECFGLLLDYALYQFHLERRDFRTLPIPA